MTTKTEYKYVPVEPTDEMLCAAFNALSDLFTDDALAVYKAMLAVAPEQPSPAEPDKESGRNAALEEAAKVCDGHAADIDVTGKEPQSWSVVRGAILVTGDMIRALQSQPAQPSDTLIEPSDGEVLQWMHRGGMIDIPSCKEAMRKYPDGLNGKAAMRAEREFK